MITNRLPRRGLWLRRGGGVALLTVVLAMAGAAPASAHPYLLRSDPAAGAILAAAPQRIDIDYTEGLDRSYCTVTLVSPSGAKITTHQVAAGAPAELAVVPDQPLKQDGTYAVQWSAVGDDGHTVIGSFGFSIGHPSANAAVSSAGGTSTGSGTAGGGIQRLLRTVWPFTTTIFAGILLLASVLAAAGRRATRIRNAMFGLQAVVVTALAGAVITDGGWAAFSGSDTGRRIVAVLVMTALAVPALRDGRVRRWCGYAAAAGLLVVLALSSHASTQPASRRDVALAVYLLHLLAVSIWLGALLAVLLLPERRRALRNVVVGTLFAVLVSGVFTTEWGLRTLHDLPSTTYGRLVITLAALFTVAVGIGAFGSRLRLLARVEAGVLAGALVVAGVLGQTAEPLDQPYASQAYAADTGMSVSVVSTGPSSLDVASLAPAIVGRNTLVVEVGQSDEQDFLSSVTDVKAVNATLSCGCGAPDQHVALHRPAGGQAWSADVNLGQAASWLVTASVRRVGEPAHTVELTARVAPARLPSQVVVGVPASLSGANGETCRDQVLGLQTALADLNSSAADHGDLVRVVTADLNDGVAPALKRLRDADARLIALPCGTTSELAQVTAAARSAGLPVVLGSQDGDPTAAAGMWSTQPSWPAEGTAIAAQAVQQQATSVTAVVGSTAVDRAELTGLRAGLSSAVPLRVESLTHSPARLVTSLARRDADLVTVLGNPAEAAPLVHALSALNQSTGWAPSHGILASAQLMSTEFINGAGFITRAGGIEFASDINPFDPIAEYYAQRLRSLSPGVRPSFDGLHGYEAGVAIMKALAAGGGSPSASHLAALLGNQFHDFAMGSYRLGWQPTGGTSTSLAFFRSTYVNPMAMPAVAPGGASSLAHEGTFLDTGGFEQVAPFRRLK